MEIMNKVLVMSILTFVSAVGFAYGGSGTVGVGNPAASFCEDVAKGTSVLVTTNRGQILLCELKGARVDQWTLYRELDLQINQKALAVFMLHPKPNLTGTAEAAVRYCEQVNGVPKPGSTSTGNTVLCFFSDYSVIDAETLLRGPQAEENKMLVELLNK